MCVCGGGGGGMMHACSTFSVLVIHIEYAL